MELGLDAQISIISYAVVSAKYESNKRIIHSFLPLVEHLLLECEEKSVSKKELIPLFKETYGYGIPPAILDALLKVLRQQEKIDFLINEGVEIYAEKLDDYDSQYEIRIRALSSDFDIFEKKQGKEIQKSVVINTFLEFLLYNAVEFNSFLNYTSNFERISDEKTDIWPDIVSFLLEERKNNTNNYRFLQEIFYGITLSTLLTSEKAQEVESDNSIDIENVLLDSNFIFRLLDLQTEFEYIATKETFDTLKKMNCNFYILPHTIRQIADTLNSAIRRNSATANRVLKIYGDDRFSGLNSACIRRSLTATILTRIIDNLENDLKNDFGIRVIPDEECKSLRYLNEDFSSLCKAKPDSSDSGIVHDLYLIEYVRSKRTPYVYKRSKAKWWVVTDDSKLTKWNAEFKKDNGVPECITESQLATVLWLNNPKKLSLDSLFSTALALRNRSLLSNDDFFMISNAIERQVQQFESNPEKYNKLSLVFTDKLIGLDEMACANYELVDDKFIKALEKEQSIFDDNHQLKKENSFLLATQKENKEKYLKCISEKDKELSENKSLLNQETLEHINTLKSLQKGNEEKLTDLQKQKEKFGKIVSIITKILSYIPISLVVLVAFIMLKILGICYENIELWYSSHQFIFYLLTCSPLLSLFTKCARNLCHKFGEKLCNKWFASICSNYNIVVDNIKIVQKEIEDIQTQIEKRLSL